MNSVNVLLGFDMHVYMLVFICRLYDLNWNYICGYGE